MQYGPLAGYALLGVKMMLLGRPYHEVDSSDMAFQIAGECAQGNLPEADPVLLEPIMAVEVKTPEENMGDVIGDLTPAGIIQAMEDRGGTRVVLRPGAAVGDVRLRRRPAVEDPGPGELQHAVRLLRRVPANVAKEIIAKATGE